TWLISIHQRSQEDKAKKKEKLLRVRGLLDEAKTIFDASWGLVSELEYIPTDPSRRQQLSEFIDKNGQINEAIRNAIEPPYPDAVKAFFIYANFLKTEVAMGKTEREVNGKIEKWGREIKFPQELDRYVDAELGRLKS